MTAGVTGVARYVAQLERALPSQGVELRRFALGRGPHPAPPETRRLRIPLRVLHQTWKVLPRPNIEQLSGGADVAHVTDLVPPPTRLPLVLTVHDLDAIDHPRLHGERARSLQLAQLRAARDRADAVITMSQATADALHAHDVEAARVTVVPLAATELPTPDPSACPDGPYFLAVGTIDERKGLDTLVRAFAAADLDGVTLVVAGPDGHGAAGLRDVLTSVGASRVVLPGRVSDAALAGLYRSALAYCLPSRAEGFGLPVVEAMANGTPVIASDLPVIRDIVGTAARLVPVDDVDGWVDALRELATDDDARRRMSAAGVVAARPYTWEATARRTVAVYESVAPGQLSSRA